MGRSEWHYLLLPAEVGGNKAVEDVAIAQDVEAARDAAIKTKKTRKKKTTLEKRRGNSPTSTKRGSWAAGTGAARCSGSISARS